MKTYRDKSLIMPEGYVIEYPKMWTQYDRYLGACLMRDGESPDRPRTYVLDWIKQVQGEGLQELKMIEKDDIRYIE